jgi:hypothetical protein
MNANLNGSGRSCGGADSNSFLALIHYIFGSSVNPGYFIYGNNRESRRGLTLKVHIALVEGVKVRLQNRGVTSPIEARMQAIPKRYRNRFEKEKKL